jgi:flagellar biosynthesis anti-sigma factor FlgM
MKVNQSASQPIQSSETKGAHHASKAHGAHKAGRAQHAHETAHEGGDVKAEVSDRAREMAMAKSAASDAPDVREDKIAEIKARIASGKYHVDSHAVADRLVDDHIRMSGIG